MVTKLVEVVAKVVTKDVEKEGHTDAIPSAYDRLLQDVTPDEFIHLVSQGQGSEEPEEHIEESKEHPGQSPRDV